MNSLRPLTEGSISVGMFRLALPIILYNVLESLNSSVNSIWVGHFLGEAALTAASNVSTLLYLLNGTAFGIATAATIVIGRCIGAEDLPQAKRVVGTSATFFSSISVVVMVVGLFLCEPMLVAMRTPPASLAMAVAYLRVFFLAAPFIYMYIFTGLVLGAAGDSKTPFYFMFLSAGLDIALNPLFIFGLGPIPALGIAGSALATLVANVVGLAALLRHLYRRRHMLVLHKDEIRHLRLDWAIVGVLVKKGIPMCAQIVVLSLSSILLITLVNNFGVNTTAAFGAAMQVWGYIQLATISVSAAVSTMAAQNLGAQKWGRVNAVTRVGVMFGLAVTITLVAVIELFDMYTFQLFLPPGSMSLQIAVHLNQVVVWSFIFLAVTFVLFGVVQAAGAVMVPLLVLTLALLLVRFPLAEAFITRYQADAVWWSVTISSALAMILAIVYYKYGGWRSARMAGGVPQSEPAPSPES